MAVLWGSISPVMVADLQFGFVTIHEVWGGTRRRTSSRSLWKQWRLPWFSLFLTMAFECVLFIYLGWIWFKMIIHTYLCWLSNCAAGWLVKVVDGVNHDTMTLVDNFVQRRMPWTSIDEVWRRVWRRCFSCPNTNFVTIMGMGQN